jgi:DNA-binding NtrC family response regulator
MPQHGHDDVSTILQHRFVPTAPSDAVFVLRVLDGRSQGATLTVDDASPGALLCGKSPVCALRIDDPAVSRRHFSVEVKGEDLHLVDLGSTNRTRVNQLAVEAAFLRGGEMVQVGTTTVHVARAPAREAPEVATASRFGAVIGASREMRRLYTLCAKLAASTVSVVIEGETGTGKEALAEALHDQGPRAAEPFVVFDCTAVPANLIESDLFGHERGAFTGAVGSRKGVFEQADRGTLLIDEIGDLDLALQAKLLRAIERGEIRRVGGNAAIRVDVRILAATRRDLDAEVQAGRFRDDLFHRLAVARIELPPLRSRKGDIPLLARHFWGTLGGDVSALPPDVLGRWESYPWPGNVRELRNAVARQIALGEDAPQSVPPASREEDVVERVLAMDLPLQRARNLIVEDFERRYLERVLARYGGNVTRAAEASGIARRHFYRLRARSSS